ncbi:MAG: MFS transporter, partial [Anaerolineales bacterium]|nr:MFS transporter [Anaerolineales bacterium]
MRMVASSAYIVGKTPARHRSTVFGIYFAIMQSNSLLSPVVGSFIDRWDYSPTFIIAAIATVAVTIICTLFLRGNRNQLSRA